MKVDTSLAPTIVITYGAHYLLCTITQQIDQNRADISNSHTFNYNLQFNDLNRDIYKYIDIDI